MSLEALILEADTDENAFEILLDTNGAGGQLQYPALRNLPQSFF